MKIAIGQINSTIGDFSGNRRRILDAATTALGQGARVIVFPELCVCGYPPMDLLDHATFVEENNRSLRQLQKELPREIAAVVGLVDWNHETPGRAIQNTAAVIHQGQVVFRQAKRLLPTYDVFDEARYFEPATSSGIWLFQGERLGIAICEDLWAGTEPAPGVRYQNNPVRDLLDQGATVLLSPAASPFYKGKASFRRELAERIGRQASLPLIYVNAVGGNDSLIFDGGSFATRGSGEVLEESARFREDLTLVDLTPLPESPTEAERAAPRHLPPSNEPTDEISEIEAALVLGLRDYLEKTGFSRVHLGLSGGIDSAVVAALAVKALGPERVTGFLMPSRYSSPGSITDAEALADNLGIQREILPIDPLYQAVTACLEDQFAGTAPGLAEENIQARLRGLLMMSWSNKFGSLTLTTGNKSELAVGYCTLYGDMAGALAVLGDVLKTEVFALARFMNREREIIPENTIVKPPSAELRPDQKDEDSLPPYPLLDTILEEYLLENRTFQEIVSRGHDPATVEHVLGLVARSEYKRRQAPPVLKVSPRAFGTGRRIPIARHIYETSR
ncbi:NAD+ synthase (glutamine-hydrolysing) [Alkalispirochaeta americana]|uniref:Glutamine-dependent NAD(+) synthetase n=1 Tax=Alkalispirochaeta americana TaxID=159291 RepID=A0A1N6RXY5_9SPIO|nr:NAD+ synthase [Alkalispirochaeta americana]SIQ33705.1 NAD+ synthase (glutamine-hydrolysing) [Alkalispirochaeta americana]